MFRLRSNCSVMLVLPCVLVELMALRPAIVANCFSSGSATDEATVSGLAPGRLAPTWMVGKSTVGRSLTGSCRYDSDAEHDDAQHDQRRRDRAFDEEGGDIHGVVFAPGPDLTLTRLPGMSRSCPSVTTVSPGVNPFSMTVSASAARATVTLRKSTV